MLSDTIKQKLQNLFSEESLKIISKLETLALDSGKGLGDLEQCLEKSLHALAQPLLESIVQAKSDQMPLTCQKCKKDVFREAKNKVRSPTTCFGKISYRRDYAWCDQCQEWLYPLDQALGLDKNNSYSPLMSERAALLVLKMPSAQAEEVSARVLGAPWSRSSLHREAIRQGERAQKIIRQDANLTQTLPGVKALSDRSQSSQSAPFTLVIQVDAFHIRERDDWGLTEKKQKKGEPISRWHWTYVGTCYRLDHASKSESGRPLISQRGYVATREGLESFERQLYACALQQGLEHAKRVLVLGDGAAWIWKIAQDRYSFAVHRLDLWHLKEHLWDLAHAIHGVGSVQAKEFVAPLIRHIEKQKNGVLQTIEKLEDLRAYWKEKIEPIEKEINYLKTHQTRMDYPQAKKREEPMGSGVIESTCKQYQCRFKRPGQFWSTTGDEALLSLETLYRNGQWKRLFPHASTTALAY